MCTPCNCSTAGPERIQITTPGATPTSGPGTRSELHRGSAIKGAPNRSGRPVAWPLLTDARDIGQEIDAARIRQDSLHTGVDRLLIGGIQGAHGGFAQIRRILPKRRRRVGIPRRGKDLSARVGQGSRSGQPDAAARTGRQCHRRAGLAHSTRHGCTPCVAMCVMSSCASLMSPSSLGGERIV